MRSVKNKKLLHLSLASLMAVSGVLSVSIARHAHAAALNQTFVRFDHISTSTVTTGTVCARPTTTSSDVKSWSVTFPTGFSLGAGTTFQNTNINTTSSGYSWPGAVTPTAWPNAASATASVSGQTVTWTNGTAQTMSSGTTYCYNWLNTTGNAVTTDSATGTTSVGSITTTDSSSVTIDTGQYVSALISNDQIVVTATVPPTFSFVLSGNTDALGTLTAATVKPSPTPRTATIGTNSKNGWMMWGKDSNTGLTSATASKTIASTTPGSNSTLSTSAEGYNTGVTYTVTSGSLTVDPAFVGGSLGKGGGLDTAQRLLISGAGVTNNAVVTLTNNVNVLASTPAATDYTDTITVTGAGLF